MSESFDIYGSLCFLKDLLIKYVSSGKQSFTSRSFIGWQGFHSYSYSIPKSMLKKNLFVKLKVFFDYMNTKVI